MRLRIAHSSVYRYDPPTAGVIQVLRLTPRNHEGQYVERWRIDVVPDARLAAHEDAFGNITHVFTTDGPLEELRVDVDGAVETQNANGVVRGTVERFPPSLFLRDTALTQADSAIRDFAQKIRDSSGGVALAELHGLLDRLFEDCVGDVATSPTPANAAEAFARKRGGPKDLAHIFIGTARTLGIPARFVRGYFRKPNAEADTSHAWAEAYVPDLGWVGFDPSNGCCPTDGHVRVAIGLDSLGAAAVRGTRLGVGAETLAVAIKVDQ
jgi:transglutaminase-like putative cysteine protease